MKLAVHTSEIHGIKHACAISDLKLVVFETTHKGIVDVLITDNGKEISPELAWRLSASAEASNRILERSTEELP